MAPCFLATTRRNRLRNRANIATELDIVFAADGVPPQPAPQQGEHRNGYAALAVFDDPANGGNGNGKIDPGDAVYSSLRLWVDKNHNGISEPDELIPLAAAGVFAIDLSYVELWRFDNFGNIFHYRANVDDSAGHSDPRCYDVYLQLGSLKK